MEITLNSPTLSGKIKAISSKSMAHRLLICAAFADTKTEIICEDTNADIEATANCLSSLGAKIEKSENGYTVTPITAPTKRSTLDCGESGSTLRFLLPISAAIGANSSFLMHGRLPERPLSPMYEELVAHGMSLSPKGTNPLVTSGKLCIGEYSIAANISSQFISGLMFALPLIGKYTSAEGDSKSKLSLLGEIESAPYIDMTLDSLKRFGIHLKENSAIDNNKNYEIPPSMTFTSPKKMQVEGDWSNAAFWLCAGAIGKAPVCVSSLILSSHQGDMKILDILRDFGASVVCSENEVTVTPSKLHGTDIDASQIPDLVPVLAVAASVAEGETIIHGASRLRIKESDRLKSVSAMLSSLGADIKESEDGLIIKGKPCLEGGAVSSENDHRIAMSAAIASTVCKGEVKIFGAEAVAKSYPCFWDDFKNLSKGETK